MGTNSIRKFCETDLGTNLETDSEYNLDILRTTGNQPGIAKSKLVNKALRQATFISKVFADYLVQQTGANVPDDSNDTTLLANITAAFATGLPVGSVVNMLTPVVPT